MLQYQLLCEAGRKDTPGRPVLYRTTENFLGHFGLDSIEDLPQLETIPADDVAARAEAAEVLGKEAAAETPAEPEEEDPREPTAE